MNPLLLGDWRYFWQENLIHFIGIPQAWDASLNTGIGKSALPTLWINSYLYITAQFIRTGMNWTQIGLLFWIIPSVFFTFFSAFYLFRYLFPKIKYGAYLAGVIYIFNTYFILLITGGQAGVALAYSITPFILLRFIKVMDSSALRDSLFAGLLLSMQFLFDIRLAYISLTIIALYFVFSRASYQDKKKLFIYSFLIPGIITLMIHNYWILPLVFFKLPPMPNGYVSVAGFKFFSFADFSHTISLLHPNWPENKFGKLAFMKPEFIILPMIGYTSLIFIKVKAKLKSRELNRNKLILFFSVVGIIGAFLSKGANGPMGEINIFLFEHFPGMSLFRDASKFYMITAISYSMLVPITISEIFHTIEKKFRLFLRYGVIAFVVLYCGVLLIQAFNNNVVLRGPKKVPQEYVKLKELIIRDDSFYRTLWIPQWQRFGYFSNLNPAIGRGEIIPISNPANMARQLKKDDIIRKLTEIGVRYVILPYDSENELFLNDNEYDENIYKNTKKELDTNLNLVKKINFGKIFVYEINNSKDRFWTISGSKLIWKEVSASEYEIKLENHESKDVIIFSDSFDPNWTLYSGKNSYRSEIFGESANSFKIPKGLKYLKVYYEPQKWVSWGFGISGISFLATLGSIIYLQNKAKP